VNATFVDIMGGCLATANESVVQRQPAHPVAGVVGPWPTAVDEAVAIKTVYAPDGNRPGPSILTTDMLATEAAVVVDTNIATTVAAAVGARATSVEELVVVDERQVAEGYRPVTSSEHADEQPEDAEVWVGAGLVASTAAAIGGNSPAEGKLASAAPVSTGPADAAVWVGTGVAATAAALVDAQPTADDQVLATTKGEAAKGSQSYLLHSPPTCRRLTGQGWWSRTMGPPPPPPSARRQSATTC